MTTYANMATAIFVLETTKDVLDSRTLVVAYALWWYPSGRTLRLRLTLFRRLTCACTRVRINDRHMPKTLAVKAYLLRIIGAIHHIIQSRDPLRRLRS